MKRAASAFKKYLIFVGAGLLIVTIGSFVVSQNEKRDLLSDDQIQQIKLTAESYSRTHTITECIDEVARQAKACVRDELPCMVSSKLYLRTCLEQSASKGRFCEGVPTGNEPVKVESYGSGYCNNHKEIDVVVCMNTFDLIEDFCHAKVKAALP